MISAKAGILTTPTVKGGAFSTGVNRNKATDGKAIATPQPEAVATARYAWAPVRPMLRHPFRSDRHLKGLDIPAAVIIAADDQVVPRVNSEALVPFSSTVTLSDALLRLALSELLAAGVAAVLLAAAGCSSVPASRSSRWARLS